MSNHNRINAADIKILVNDKEVGRAERYMHEPRKVTARTVDSSLEAPVAHAIKLRAKDEEQFMRVLDDALLALQKPLTLSNYHSVSAYGKDSTVHFTYTIRAGAPVYVSIGMRKRRSLRARLRARRRAKFWRNK